MQADDRRRTLDRAVAGDSTAFETLVEARIGPMLRTAMAITGDEADARDAVQDALLAAWRSLGSLRDPEAFDAWLTRILVHRCRRGLRRTIRARVREVPVDGVDESAMAPSPDPAAAVVERRALDRAFDRLSIDERTILVLHHLDGHGITDLARILEIPAGTAKSRLFAARRSLDRALAREEPR